MLGVESGCSARLALSAGGVVAEVIVRGGEGGGDLAPELCVALCAEGGVRVDVPAMEALRTACAGLAPGEERRVEVARGRAPVHGRDGGVAWEPTLLGEAEAVAADARTSDAIREQPSEASGGVDHYQRCAFAMVKSGQLLGKVTEPTPGEDGVDVTGKSLAAKAGRPARLRLNETILKVADGTLVAQRDGVLRLGRDTASVDDLLRVPGCVDFSTGHIEFTGGVEVAKGVRDLFRVRATGSVRVHGLVECAVLDAGGDLEALGGMAGRGKGVAHCRGRVHARYITGFEVRVGGDLEFDKEIIDSVVAVGGSVESVNGTIIGGEMSVIGRVKVGTLGAASGVKTVLAVGSVPQMEERLTRLEELLSKLTERQRAFEDEFRRLSTPGRRLTTTDKERSTELTFEIQRGAAAIGKATAARDRVARIIAGLSTVEVSVASEVHPGVVLRVGRREFRVRERLKGPIMIVRNRAGDVVVRGGSDGPGTPGTALSRWCEGRAAA